MKNRPSLASLIAENNQIPWFLDFPDTCWWITPGMWMDTVKAIKAGNDHPNHHDGDLSSFSVNIATKPILGIGKNGAEYVNDHDGFLPMPWSDKVIILTPDVLVLISVRPKKDKVHLRDIVQKWLRGAGVKTTYDPATNDMLINNKKFMGAKSFHSPHGYTTELGIVTIHKDEKLFKEMLPKKFQTTAKGHELTGISDEVKFDILDDIADLFKVGRGETDGNRSGS